MVILNTRRHEGIVQDAVKRRDQYKVRIAVEDGGKIYGGNGFEKDGNGTADHIKWILQAVLMLLKLVLGIAKLFLLLLALVARVVLTMVGVMAGRR